MIIRTEFVPRGGEIEISLFKTTWTAPSNIALVKYWGKKELQIPCNPSVSFTLDKCRTTTTVRFEKQIDAKILYENGLVRVRMLQNSEWTISH